MTTRPVPHSLTHALDRTSTWYELIDHARTTTARAEARVLDLDPHDVAKTVVLTTPTGFVRAVLPASERLDIEKTQDVLGTNEVTLATEEAIAGAYPAFELGAVPPLAPDGDRVLVDRTVCERETVVFEAGTHETSIRLRTADLVELCDGQVVDVIAA